MGNSKFVKRMKLETVKKMLEVVKKLSGNNNLTHAIANQDSITSNQIFNKALYNLNSS